MSAHAPEQASHLPPAHEHGQRAFPEAAGGAAVAGPSQAAQVSPQTSEITPVVQQAEPVSPHQENVQAAQPEAAGHPNVAVANAADAEQARQQEKLPPITSGWKRTYLIASAIIFLLSIVGLGLDAKAVSDDPYDDTFVTIVLTIGFGIYALTIVFVPIEVTVRAVNKWEQGIHPAVHTAVWLVCWLLYAALVVIFALVISYDRQNADAGYYDNDYDFSRGYSSDPYIISQLVFSCILLVGTFFLFVFSCMETQAYNLRMGAPAAPDASGTMVSNFYDHRAWRKAKLAMNMMVIVLGLIGLAIGISLVQYINVRDVGIIFPACAAVLILPIGWAIADVCFAVCGRTRRKVLQGMAPGAHVGMWLISWIAVAIIAGILTTYAVIVVSDCRYDPNDNMRRSVSVTDDSSSSTGYGSYPYGGYPYSDYPYGYGGRDESQDCITDAMVGPIIATCVFAWIVFLLSFILFVAGCSDTYLRNRRAPPPVVYVAVQPLPYGQYHTQPIYAAAPMAGQEKQMYAAAPVAGYGTQPIYAPQPIYASQPMMQVAPRAPMQQQPQPAPPGGVVEYYGTAQ